MTPTDPRQQAAIDAALNLVLTTASSVAGRVSETLVASASTSARIAERDLLNSAQFELRRNMGTFHLMFKGVLQQKVEQELAPPGGAHRKLADTDWHTLTLVDDHAVEERMYADRIGQMIAHECEVELRDMAAYMGSLLNNVRLDQDRNPLRAEVLGATLYRAIESVSEQGETRKLLARDMGLAMARAMPACYARIVSDLQGRGVQPLVLTVRGVDGPGNKLPGLNSAYATLNSAPSRPSEIDATESGSAGSAGSTGSINTNTNTTTGFGSRSGAPQARAASAAERADAQLMSLLRRLTGVASRPGELDTLQRHSGAGRVSSFDSTQSVTVEDAAHSSAMARGQGLSGLMAVNLIRAHRNELMQASTGQLDHMVIEVVGSLFDQILSDARVPPQMARQIARLQLPVLRVALHDSSFFSSRRHPVRRFVNRIASLACAHDDFDDGPGGQLLLRVRELVQEIVEGDFDQIDIYAAKLAQLELFTSEHLHGEVQKTGAASTLDSKESELRIQQRYTMQLQAALQPIALPPYLREFLPQVWSQALVLAVRRDGPASDRAQRFRRVGGDLVMSVQPKGSPVLRKRFLMQLSPLMKDLNEGMKLVGWPEAAQKEFFGKLLPAQSESLKGQPLSELDYNMMAKQLEAIFNAPVPGVESLTPADPLPVVDEAVIAQRFSPEEVKRVGFVAEAAVDWAGCVDIDLDALPEPTEAADSALFDLGVDISLDLSSSEPSEPTRGPQLIDHIQLGFAYQMHLKDEWRKVRLAHVSAGRSFFLFTRGEKHQETISMTSRMLARMCESGRLRAVESAYLIERATQRARKQMVALKGATRH